MKTLGPALALSSLILGGCGSDRGSTQASDAGSPPDAEKIGTSGVDSGLDRTRARSARIVPPKGGPNVLLILTDDAGYGVASTFGGVIPTPALDRIAKAGLRYTQFHSTALCAPSRAALLTGRNHHAVGFGIADAYHVPFRFTGKLAKLTVKLGPSMLPSDMVAMEKRLLERADRARAQRPAGAN